MLYHEMRIDHLQNTSQGTQKGSLNYAPTAIGTRMRHHRFSDVDRYVIVRKSMYFAFTIFPMFTLQWGIQTYLLARC